jgi:hypothetical protein
MKFGHLEPGLTVYDVGRQKMGNTTLSTVAVWHVTIVSVDADSQSVMASWNGNPAKRFYKYAWSKWRLKRPVLIDSSFGSRRLATREELKAMKEATT